MNFKNVLPGVIGLGMLAASFASAQAATVTVASSGSTPDPINALSISVDNGTSFSLDLWALSFPADFVGGTMEITYDANLLSLNSFTPGTTYNTGSSALTVNPFGTDTAGTLTFNVVATAPNTFLATNGILGTLAFTALTTGNLVLGIADHPWDPTWAQSGQISPTYLSANVAVVTPVNPVPLPPALWLLGSALVGLMGMSRRKQAVAA